MQNFNLALLNHNVQVPFYCGGVGGGSWTSYQIKKKKEGGRGEGEGGGSFTGSPILEGGWLLEKRGLTFFIVVGCSFYIKNKLKSEMFNDKKSL